MEDFRRNWPYFAVMVIVVVIAILAPGCTVNRPAKYVIFQPGSINQYGGSPPMGLEPILNDAGETIGFHTVPSGSGASASGRVDESGDPVAGSARGSLAKGDTASGLARNSHFIIISIGQDDGTDQTARSDAAVEAAANVTSPGATATVVPPKPEEKPE